MKLLSYGDDSALKVDETGFYVSFADMMTLLMVFFVLMFSISKPDDSKFDEVASSMVQAFNQEVAQDIIDEVNLLEELERNLDTTIVEMSLSGEISAEMMDQISTEITPDGLKLELASSALFSRWLRADPARYEGNSETPERRDLKIANGSIHYAD